MAPAHGPVQRGVPPLAHHRPDRRPLPLRQPDPQARRPRRTDPRPWVEVHPSHGFRNGDPVRVVTRRGSEVFPALVTEAIRPDTVFIPYHWPVPTSANALTIDALDPRSKIPEYKVCAARIEAAEHVDDVPAPPTAPGQQAYPETQVSRLDPLPPTSPRAAAPRRGADPHMMGRTIFIDPGRCIGCQACVSACRECDSHRGKSMIHLDYPDEGHSVASLPTVCMHCEDPVAPCAEVCPADAILVTADGVVQQADTTRCIGCANCVNACPFGVPKIDLQAKLQMKCNLCYDRTAYGLAPMCATVCPTGALFYGTLEELQAERPGVQVADSFTFGTTTVTTGVAMVVPADKVQWPVPGGLPVVEINGVDVSEANSNKGGGGRREGVR